MIPSMHAFGGWSGFLGMTRPAVPAPKTLKALAVGRQLFPDTASREYASLLRDSDDGRQLPPLTTIDASTPFSVALIGGGIANVIAAYELARCGIRVTLFDRRKRLGGRMNTDQPYDEEAPVREFGPTSFPAESRLLWHYVRVWAGLRCQGKPLDPDLLLARPYSGPGQVPTAFCYQNTWHPFDLDLESAPLAVREAARVWRSFLAGLNDGIPEPQTKYLADIQKAARRANFNDEFSLHLFWKEMTRRYEHKSVGEVLQTEVFAHYASAEPDVASSVPNLMHAFGSVGVGTGGFASLFDVGFLELLRNIIWDTSGDYLLPSHFDYPALYEPDNADGAYGMAALVNGLARATWRDHDTTTRPFADMFKTNVGVQSITVKPGDGQPDKVVVRYQDQAEEFDFAIVAASTRAMQMMGLDLDTQGSPYTRMQPHSEDSLRAVEGIQAAIHHLDMVSATRAVIEVKAPWDTPDWPATPDKARYSCFVTDRYAQVTSFLDQSHVPHHTQAVVTALGNEALKFQTSRTPLEDLPLIASSFDPPDAGPWPWAVVGSALRDGRITSLDWNRTPGVGGGFKQDLPGSTYLSACLFFHCMLAGAETEKDVRPYSRVFLAGDSVGFLGGWAEGSAMSSLNAVTAVLVQVEKQSGRELKIRSRDLVKQQDYQRFDWTHLTMMGTDLPRLKGSTWIVDCSKDELKPGRWREEAGLDCRLHMLAVSQDGYHMLGRDDDGALWFRNFNDDRDPHWEPLAPLDLPPGAGDLESVGITCDSKPGAAGAGEVHVVVNRYDQLPIFGTPLTWHCVRGLNGKWSGWGRVQYGPETPVVADRSAVAATGQGRVYVATLNTRREPTGIAMWGVRNANGSWDTFEPVGPPGVPRKAKEIALDVKVSLGKEIAVFGLLTVEGAVVLTMRMGDSRRWTPDVELPAPLNGLGQPLTVERISLVCIKAGQGRIIALASDRNVYHRTFDANDPHNAGDGRWRRVPFPHGAPYAVRDLAIGRSNDRRDAVGSTAVWSVSPPATGDDSDLDDVTKDSMPVDQR